LINSTENIQTSEAKWRQHFNEASWLQWANTIFGFPKPKVHQCRTTDNSSPVYLTISYPLLLRTYTSIQALLHALLNRLTDQGINPIGHPQHRDPFLGPRPRNRLKEWIRDAGPKQLQDLLFEMLLDSQASISILLEGLQRIEDGEWREAIMRVVQMLCGVISDSELLHWRARGYKLLYY